MARGMTSVPNENNFHQRLFDFQVNGFAGVDFQGDDLGLDAWLHAVTELRNHGAGQIFVALITDEPDRLCRRLEAIERVRERSSRVAETIVGYHLEGPWLNPAPGFRGAHPERHMAAPSVPVFERLQAAASGRIRLVTLAPELPGSVECIAHCSSHGVAVSLGHTDASAKQIDEAIKAGARFCTHLGNATPATLPRHNNVIQRLLARDELTACFIADGIHLPGFVLRNFYRAKPPGKSLFTTDAMAAAGAAPGRHTLGSMVVDVGANGVARQPDGREGFAGSTLTPDEGVRRTAYYLGITLGDAEKLWSDAPRRAFNIGEPT
jgi:N-acetylglucosamine-6-phosphate deacetylase